MWLVFCHIPSQTCNSNNSKRFLFIYLFIFELVFLIWGHWMTVVMEQSHLFLGYEILSVYCFLYLRFNIMTRSFHWFVIWNFILIFHTNFIFTWEWNKFGAIFKYNQIQEFYCFTKDIHKSHVHEKSQTGVCKRFLWLFSDKWSEYIKPKAFFKAMRKRWVQQAVKKPNILDLLRALGKTKIMFAL